MKKLKNGMKKQRTETDFDFQQIGVKLENCIVRVDNDAALKSYMGLSLKQAMALAEYIRKEYRKQYTVSLKITTASLAIELLGHFLVQEICLKVKKIFGGVQFLAPVLKFCDRMLAHTDVIDCGEKHCDNNRFLWDWISIPVVAVQKMRRRYL